MKKTRIYTPDEIKEIASLEWLNLGDAIIDMHFDNPLEFPSEKSKEDPFKHIIGCMMKPENFWWVVKEVLGIELLPFQCVILHELWHHKFPMFIATRGGGKCITGDSFIMTDSGIGKIGNIVGVDYPEHTKKFIKGKLLGEKGFTDIDYAWNNGYGSTIKIKTRMGYELEMTPDHPVRVVRNNDIIWVEAKDIKRSDYIPIDRSETWFPKPNDLPEDLAYLFGVLVGDGGYTVRGRITVTSTDGYIAKQISKTSKKYFGKPFIQQPSDKIQYLLCGVDIWDSLFVRFGFNSPVCSKKDFPTSVLSASKSSVAAFIRGLMDTDGGCFGESKASITLKSKNCIKTLQFILTRFGIISSVSRRFNKKYRRYYYRLTISGDSLRKFYDEIGFDLRYKQKKLKKIYDKKSNTNVDILPRVLIKDRVLSLAKKFRDLGYIVDEGHGYSRTRGLFSNWRLSKYQISYRTLSEILDILKPLSDDPEWQFLDNLLNRHLFFDQVKYIRKGKNQTFDVHLKDDHSFISNGLISHNTFLLSVYALLRCILVPGTKVVIVGAAFRQSKILFEYVSKMWNESPLLQNMMNPEGTRSKFAGPSIQTDRCTIRLGQSEIIAIPMGTGDKIRGLRANVIIADEFQSLQEDVYERVVKGFGAVSLNPGDMVKKEAARNALKRHGAYDESLHGATLLERVGNQSIISGTAYYEFNHFYKYYKRYKSFIESRGDRRKLEDIFGGDDIPRDFDWKDYCVIRLPVELLPRRFMDEGTIASTRANSHRAIIMMEYGGCFSKDSEGFFKRSLIESCVAKDCDNPIEIDGKEVVFHAKTRGSNAFQYVIGVDPAAVQDNFSIVVLELHHNHRRIVYCWTTTKKSHKELIKQGIITENSFYDYCARKIRDLMKVFPTVRIALDSQGGGIAVEECLQDPERLKHGERRILPVVDPDKPKDTDNEVGNHILELINFAKADWVTQANQGMRKDFEDRVLLFPHFDSISIEEAIYKDTQAGIKHDTLEDCIMEIEELKDELASITHTQTPSGRDHFDTPEIKLAGNKKGRLRKDRYSALLMANMVARQFQTAKDMVLYDQGVGGFSHQQAGKKVDGSLYSGPSWFTEATQGSNWMGVARDFQW